MLLLFTGVKTAVNVVDCFLFFLRDLLFIWSRLHLRAHPSREGFLAECLSLASSATNVRAIFPFIKLVTTEVRQELYFTCHSHTSKIGIGNGKCKTTVEQSN